jgi:hypothetical protein
MGHDQLVLGHRPIHTGPGNGGHLPAGGLWSSILLSGGSVPVEARWSPEASGERCRSRTLGALSRVGDGTPPQFDLRYPWRKCRTPDKRSGKVIPNRFKAKAATTNSPSATTASSRTPPRVERIRLIRTRRAGPIRHPYIYLGRPREPSYPTRGRAQALRAVRSSSTSLAEEGAHHRNSRDRPPVAASCTRAMASRAVIPFNRSPRVS